VEHDKPELVGIIFTVKPGSGTGCPSGWLARMIGFSHQPSVLTLNSFFGQQLNLPFFDRLTVNWHWRLIGLL